VTPAARGLFHLTEVIADVQDAVVQIKTPDGAGTGFIVTSEGLVLTNAHVVGSFIRVHILAEGLGIVGGQGIVAEVIGVDQAADLALISLEPRSGGYPHVSLADSDQAVLGEDVVAIGYPLGPVLGKGITVTRGIVSSRSHINGIEYIQTDAALNPGSSGGPLVNMDGEVLGINTVRLEENENRAVQGIAFAIASNSVKKLLTTLLPAGVSLE
jgi:putative serine protease PepD